MEGHEDSLTPSSAWQEVQPGRKDSLAILRTTWQDSLNDSLSLDPGCQEWCNVTGRLEARYWTAAAGGL